MAACMISLRLEVTIASVGSIEAYGKMLILQSTT